MSGHSKWKTIKHKKEAADQKRSKVFGRVLRVVSLAAKNGANPKHNPALRTAIEKARKENVPQENINRAINRATEQGSLEELVLEVYGPGGCALIIKALTDNKNRTIPEVKKILSDTDGRLADIGSVQWSFNHAPEEDEEWAPKFFAEISARDKEKTRLLVTALEEHSDVEAVYTNMPAPHS